MPAAATTWFATPSATTKTAMQPNATSSRRSTDESSAPSFLDSLQSASLATRPESHQPESTTETKPATQDQPAASKAASKPRKPAARSTSKEKSTQSDNTETAAKHAESNKTETCETAETQADDVTIPQADAQEPTDETDPALTAQQLLVTVSQQSDVQDTQPQPETTDELPPEIQANAQTKKELHLPWRHYHEKPAANADQQTQTEDDAQSDLAAATLAAQDQPELPIDPDKNDEQNSADPQLGAQTSEAKLPVQSTGQQASQDSENPEDQDKQAAQQHHDAAPVKPAKPKPQAAPTANAHEPQVASDKPDTTKHNPALNPTAATATPDATASAQTLGADRDNAASVDTTSAIITDATAHQDKQSQTHAAGSAHGVQQTAQDSPAETFDQIVLGLRTKIDPKNTKAEIHLNPPELGALKVSVSISDGQLTAEFTAQNQMVRDLLSNNMERLRNVLEGQGVSVDRLAVQTAPDGQVASSQSPSQQQESQNSFDSQHDGRSNGNMGQSQQRMPQRHNSSDFAAMLSQEKPLDMVA